MSIVYYNSDLLFRILSGWLGQIGFGWLCSKATFRRSLCGVRSRSDPSNAYLMVHAQPGSGHNLGIILKIFFSWHIFHVDQSFECSRALFRDTRALSHYYYIITFLIPVLHPPQIRMSSDNPRRARGRQPHSQFFSLQYSRKTTHSQKKYLFTKNYPLSETPPLNTP